MNPSDKLKEIEKLFRLNQEMYKRQGIKQSKSEIETFEWLISRIKVLTEALEFYANIPHEGKPEDISTYARQTLEGDDETT